PADFGTVEVNFVDLAVAELDISELRFAQIEVGDAAVGETHFLPHTVEYHAGPDPCSGDRGMQQVSTRHVQGVGTAVRDLRSGGPDSGEVARGAGLALVHGG